MSNNSNNQNQLFRWGFWFIIAFIGHLQLRITGNNNSSWIYMVYNSHYGMELVFSVCCVFTRPRASATTILSYLPHNYHFLKKAHSRLNFSTPFKKAVSFQLSFNNTFRIYLLGTGRTYSEHTRNKVPSLHRAAITKQRPLITKLLLSDGWGIVACLAVVA
jgi:hypothetical protein